MAQLYPVSAIAQLLKLTERRIQQLVKDGILPRPIQGNYDAIACTHAYIDYLRRLVAGSGELSLTDERTRLTKLQADLAQVELDKQNGDLIKTDIAMKLWGEVITATRQRLLGFPTRIAPIVAASQSIPEIKERLDSAICEILNEFTSPNLSEHARTERHTESLEGLCAAPKAHNKSVGGQKKKTKSRK